MQHDFFQPIKSVNLAKTFLAVTFLGLVIVPAVPQAVAEPLTEETLWFRPFGTVHIYRNSPKPERVVLFMSGDGGWHRGVINMAKALADMNSLVAGVDITAYLKHLAADPGACAYPAADFEELSQYLQKRYGYTDYQLPVLAGYSSGATLVYATLAQAPPNTFRAGLSLGFCASLPLRRPLCHGSGLLYQSDRSHKGFEFLPAPDLHTPWIAIQGDIDQVCSADATAKLVAQTGNARMVRLSGVGHGFSVERNWMPQLRDNFNRIFADSDAGAKAISPGLNGLPLVEVHTAHPGNTIAVIISGDGGWASIDKSIAEALADDGIPSVGLDSLHFFWTRRTPDEAGKALQEILQHYLTDWNMDKAILIGYSRGADVLPFMASRLPPELVSKISLIVLLGAEHSVDFEIRVIDWLPGKPEEAQYKVLPEVKKLVGRKLLCVYGKEEAAPLCPDLDPAQFESVRMPGGHHFDGNYKALADLILRKAR